MKINSGIATVLLICLLMAVETSAFDKTSFRLQSMGAELRGIVDDEYTDLLNNPAYMNVLSKNWIITNLSNYSGGNHQFFNYNNNNYEGGSGAFLLGHFYNYNDMWIGFIGEYWRDKRWKTRSLNMDYYLDPYFDWGGDTEFEGTWIEDHEQGNNAYRTIDTKKGTEYRADDQGVNLNAIFNINNFGINYEFNHTKYNAPLYVYSYNDYYTGQLITVEIPFQSYAYHKYEVFEVGSTSNQEALIAIQEEANEFHNEIYRHTITFGWKSDTSNTYQYDVKAGFIYGINSNNSEIRRMKTIDYDPDNDNNSAYWNNYDTYEYQNHSQEDGDLKGLGYIASARLKKRISDDAYIRVMGNLYYQPLSTDDYKTSFNTVNNLQSLGGVNPISNTYDWQTNGSREFNTFNSMLGIGSVFNPVEDLTIGCGLKWKYLYNESISDFEQISSSQTVNEPKDESSFKQNQILFPLGMEYLYKSAYAFRIGVNTYFNSQKFTYASTTSMEGYYSDISKTEFQSINRTIYSYGFGYIPSENIQIDITGLTNLTDISNLFLSIIFKY